jgi:hypothetical protein|uniref:Uncharacterized protein n=1 Tax=Leviviridae sp. TaxID=2027243 RepID=A0A514D3M5_9VIRU|nr:MAG: hypothetical protein H4BulkLitter22329_000002 [Leviviridae sp.]
MTPFVARLATAVVGLLADLLLSVIAKSAKTVRLLPFIRKR